MRLRLLSRRSLLLHVFTPTEKQQWFFYVCFCEIEHLLGLKYIFMVCAWLNTDLCLCFRLRRSCATEEHVSASLTISRRRLKRLFSGYFLSSASSSKTLSSMRSETKLMSEPDGIQQRHHFNRFMFCDCNKLYINLSYFSGLQPKPPWPSLSTHRTTGLSSWPHKALKETPPDRSDTCKMLRKNTKH